MGSITSGRRIDYGAHLAAHPFHPRQQWIKVADNRCLASVNAAHIVDATYSQSEVLGHRVLEKTLFLDPGVEYPTDHSPLAFGSKTCEAP